MDLGSGFSIPHYKGVLDGDNWIPATPEKPVKDWSNCVQTVMTDNQTMGDNWQDLLGIYTGVLQNEARTDLPRPSNPGVTPINAHNPIHQNSDTIGVRVLKTRLQDTDNVATYNRLPQYFDPNGCAGNSLEQNIGDFGMFPNLRSLDNNNVGSCAQNLGEFISLAELMGMAVTSGTNVPLPNLVSSNGCTRLTGEAVVSRPHTIESSQMMSCTPVGIEQNHIFLNSSAGGYSLRQMPNSVVPVPRWQSCNLNLPPPSSEAGESSIAAFSLEPATPDQQKQSKNYGFIQGPNSLQGDTSAKEIYPENNALLCQQPEILERGNNESLLNTLDKPTDATLASPGEKIISDAGNKPIDLSKTPQQRTVKRRKHRPKVVVEGKLKRTPNPKAAAKSSPNDGKPTVKRKYVRKSGTKTSTSSVANEGNVEASAVRPATKSCKRLNFDLAGGEFGCQEQNNEKSKVPFDLNLDSNTVEWSQIVNKPSTSALMDGHQNIQQIQIANNFVPSNTIHSQESFPIANNFVSSNTIHSQESFQLTTTVPTPSTSKDHALNIIARILKGRNASGNENMHNQVHQRLAGGGLGQLITQANCSDPNLQSRSQAMLQTSYGRGSKRGYDHTILRQPENITTLMGSQLWSRGFLETDHFNRYGNLCRTSSGVATVEDFSGQKKSRYENFIAGSSTLQQIGGLANFDSNRQSIPRYSDTSVKAIGDWRMNYPDARDNFTRQYTLSQVLYGEQETKRAFYLSNELRHRSLSAVTNQNLESTSQRNTTSDIINSTDPVTVKKRSVGRPPKKVVRKNKVVQKKSKSLVSYEFSSTNVIGFKKDLGTSLSIDDITNCMKGLQLSDNGRQNVWNERSAVVPYDGRDGAIVPYGELDLVKKKKERPRVDLDPESNRLWNLLMGKEGSESAETMDTDKQKWWEEERRVFRGRVDSFIARMHLVQGDRRFSKWKGSVVDSVIGVFLTQNVSDHLSSSAFMSLAAKFPVKLDARQPCGDGKTIPSVQHQVVSVTYPDGTTSKHKVITEITHNSSSVASIKSSEDGAENVDIGKSTFSINDHIRRTEEDLLSSHSTSESLVFQASEDIRSSSGSNSEAEDGWNFGKTFGHFSVSGSPQDQSQFVGVSLPNTSPLIGHQQADNSVDMQNVGSCSSSDTHSLPLTSEGPNHENSGHMLNNFWTSLLMGQEILDADTPDTSGKDCTTSLAATDFEICNGERESQFQPSPVNCMNLNNCQEPQPEMQNGQDFSKHGEQGNHVTTSQHYSESLIDSTNSTAASNKQPIDNEKPADKTLEPTENGKVHSSEKPPDTTNSTTPNTRKRKVEKNKAEPFNWDALRVQAQLNGRIRERSTEAMDSLNYEALRNADVRVISDTIKERGMNNMLAERIKDFLNRLVRDHGRIDLEWLRDIPPDKAKDYLLSIWGLGLKSVECVRLLTLHHLAFPVDTNVGRIAVRLGWVPLQPLPESLQLHLLELYPVLETIQKYLWPRLCNLDQETLYELHYQMITFGKVFCTKRDPNCNACPMRGECRHFASAFASARLSLPGPEEKRIVSSTAPASAEKWPGLTVQPMLLPSSEDNVESGITRNSEPLIEEPTSPEPPPAEVLEKDIEDAFYEDPDEIPTIKLNVEQFTSNLQSIMQGKMEMGEGDMSKALVALSPELASIPVPKLKHVSRLRTEHQVYELPDSHPLLEGMDRREPDDPSPYLLAIWTPGETADSVQTPESICRSQEGGGFCNNKTCFTCNSTREAQAQTVRGTILIPCRTAMRGSFPLNGTYFQVNEVFADHDSSLNPIDVPRNMLWNLPRRTVFFGTSVSSIFKGLSTEGIQFCFWKGFVCVRGFDHKNRSPRPLKARLHFPASKMAKRNE